MQENATRGYGVIRSSVGQPLITRHLPVLVTAAAAMVSIAFAGLSGREPRLLAGLGGAAVVAISGWALARLLWLRVAVLVFGGLLTLQSSGSVTPTKLAYLAVASLIIIAAAWDVLLSGRIDLSRYSGVIFAAFAMAAYLLLTLAQSFFDSRSTLAWFRDAVPYLLLVASPLIALSIGDRISRRHLEAILIVAGLFDTAAYMVQWFSNRHVGALGVTQIGFGSTMMAAGAFCYASAKGLHGNSTWRAWLFFAAVVAGGLAVTGSRTTLILFGGLAAGIPAAVAGGYFGRAAARLGGVIALTVVATIILALATGVSLSYFAQRVDLLSGGGPARTLDGSAIERGEETALALSIFEQHPATGQGLGIQYHTVRVNGQPRASFTMDTGLLLLSKFGVAGVFLAVIYGIGVVRLARLISREAPERIALLGLGCVAIVALPLMLATEDKGFPLVLTLLMALVLSRYSGNLPTRDCADTRAQ